jgi:stalled ribosome alternative rescue factor ArfA
MGGRRLEQFGCIVKMEKKKGGQGGKQEEARKAGEEPFKMVGRMIYET